MQQWVNTVFFFNQVGAGLRCGTRSALQDGLPAAAPCPPQPARAAVRRPSGAGQDTCR